VDLFTLLDWDCSLVDAAGEPLVNRQGDLLRPYLTIIIDSYSGCVAGFHINLEPPGSHEVALALRHAILPKRYGAEYGLDNVWNVFGVPEYWMTDRAEEFKSVHMRQVSIALHFKRRLRAFPSAGGLVETVFDKTNKEFWSTLPGYTGSNVESRPAGAEKHACITITELERRLVKFLVDHYNQHIYPKDNWHKYPNIQAEQRFERWQSCLLDEPEELDERALDVCLLKTTRRRVEKYGCVRFEKLTYQGSCLADKHEGQPVSLRFDKRNILSLLVYTCPQDDQPGEFIGVVRARDFLSDGEFVISHLSLWELRSTKRKLRERHKEIGNASILNERLSQYQFVETKRKSKRQRRREAQEIYEQKNNQSKIIELFPQNASEEESVIDPEEIVTSVAKSPTEKPVDSIQALNPLDGDSVKSKRSRASVSDWNQFTRNNW
jgi:putative transposase